MLRDLADHTDRATARATAKFTEYPADHLRLGGGAWPVRPTALAVVTIIAAIGIGLLPINARLLFRRRLQEASK